MTTFGSNPIHIVAIGIITATTIWKN